MNSRVFDETPGGTGQHAAHRMMESITMDREVMHIRDSLIPKYSELVYNGFWYAAEREALQAMFDHIQQTVTGSARLKLYKGSATVVGRKADNSLWSDDYASFEAEDVYSQADADGFIKLNALRLRTLGQRKRKLGL